MRTLKSIVAVSSPAATAAGSRLRRAPSFCVELWHSSQYSTWLRRLPWIEKSLENSPWQVAQFWVSTMVRCGCGGEPSTENVTTGFTAASEALTLEVNWTVRLASAPRLHVALAAAGSGEPNVSWKRPLLSGPTIIAELPSALE